MVSYRSSMSDKLKGRYKVHPIEKIRYKNIHGDDKSNREDSPQNLEEVSDMLEGNGITRTDSVEITGEKPDPGVYTEEEVTGGNNVSSIYGENSGENGFNPTDYGIAVKKESMPAGLFGWTITGSGIVHVSDNLYSKDEKKTISHEKKHQRFPGMNELGIRYLNGDTDPENTVSANYMKSGRKHY